MKKIFLLVFILFLAVQQTYARQYDDSIDAHIRKQHNVKELPPLPKTAPSKPSNTKPSEAKPKKAASKINVPKEVKNYTASGKTYTIKAGTKLILVSKSKITNWNSEGAKFSFLLQNPVMLKEGAVIPAGTLVRGTLTESHAPQITGNGGLAKIKISEIYYNGILSVIDADLTEVNSKKVFRNNIKGRRRYLKNCSRAMTPGRKTFSAMKKTSNAISAVPVLNAVPLILGGAVYLVNIPIAPFASVFMTGGAVNLPAGTAFYAVIQGDNKIRG